MLVLRPMRGSSIESNLVLVRQGCITGQQDSTSKSESMHCTKSGNLGDASDYVTQLSGDCGKLARLHRQDITSLGSLF